MKRSKVDKMNDWIDSLGLGIVIGTAILVISVLVSSCGPLSPHVNVDAHVDLSGQVNVSVSLEQITQFFRAQCRVDLGPNATSDEVEACAASRTNSFLNLIAGGKT